jgi:hypothetical protein
VTVCFVTKGKLRDENKTFYSIRKSRAKFFISICDGYFLFVQFLPQHIQCSYRGFSKKGMNDTKGCEDWNKSKQMGSEEAKIILKNNRCK